MYMNEAEKKIHPSPRPTRDPGIGMAKETFITMRALINLELLEVKCMQNACVRASKAVGYPLSIIVITLFSTNICSKAQGSVFFLVVSGDV